MQSFTRHSQPIRVAVRGLSLRSRIPNSGATRLPYTRTYAQTTTNNKGEKASEASPGVSSNVREPVSGSSSSQQVNTSRGTEAGHSGSASSDSAATPVSNPEKGGIGGQDEPTTTAGQMKQDPDKPASEKREQVEKIGQNKKLDAAD